MGSEPPSLQHTCRRGNAAGKIPDPLLLIGDPIIMGGTVLDHAELPHALQDVLHAGSRSLSAVAPPSYCDSQKLPSLGKPNKPWKVPPPNNHCSSSQKKKMASSGEQLLLCPDVEECPQVLGTTQFHAMR